MFPQLSDIEDKIYYRIQSRANSINAKLAVTNFGGKESDYEAIAQTSGLLETSKLNTWVKAISGARGKYGQSDGMILKSIQDWEEFDKDFSVTEKNEKGKATKANRKNSYYGNANINNPRSGTIGISLTGKEKETPLSVPDRLLRPSPIITGLEIKEGQDQISRECTMNIKCFTLGQLEMIQTYFMEPGYTLYIEYGWNTPNLVGPITAPNTNQNAIITEAAKRGLNYDHLHEVRLNSDGNFDCFLGFIVGGSVSSENEVFNVSITLRGQPGLPTYLQGQHKVNKLDSSGMITGSANYLSYKGEELEDSKDATATTDPVFKAKQRFKYMFNDLAEQRQIEEVKKLEINNNPLVSLTRFINFDKTIQTNIGNYVRPGGLEIVKNVIATGNISQLWNYDVIEVTDSKGTKVEIDKKDLFSNNRYIKMDLAVKILNSNNAVEGLNMGGNNVSVRINIDSSICGAFKYMFSTDPGKLIVPGEQPDFMAFFLNANNITLGATEGGAFHAEYIVIDGNILKPVDNSISGVSFVQKVETPAVIPYREGANHWGYLKDLYVNFDMFNSKIKQSNKTISEVLLDILNEMSSAVNSYWNFQIVETKLKVGDAEKGLKKGDIVLTVVDENFVGKPDNKSVRKSFYHSGRQSPFLESNLDLSIPAEMANKLIMSRLSYSSNPDSQFAQGGSFFDSTTDLFLSSVRAPKDASGPPPPPTPATPADDAKKDALIKEYEDAGQKLAELEAKHKQSQQTRYNTSGELEYYYAFDDAAVEAQAKILRDKQTKAEEDFQKITGFTGIKIQGEIAQRKANAAKGTASENLRKIDVVPNPEEKNISSVQVGEAMQDLTKLRTFFRSYCLTDVPYFDMLKQNAFAAKRDEKQYQLSHPLPITYRFKTMGISGLRRGDMFVIDGIPDKYKKNGVFQITELEQSVSDSLWTTSVTGKYRQFIQEIK